MRPSPNRHLHRLLYTEELVLIGNIYGDRAYTESSQRSVFVLFVIVCWGYVIEIRASLQHQSVRGNRFLSPHGISFGF